MIIYFIRKVKEQFHATHLNNATIHELCTQKYAIEGSFLMWSTNLGHEGGNVPLVHIVIAIIAISDFV